MDGSDGKSPRQQENESLLEEIKRANEMSRRIYGSPQITAELHAIGKRCGKNRIAWIIRENGIVAKTHRRFKVTTDAHHDLPVAPNILDKQVEIPSYKRFQEPRGVKGSGRR
jgi:putative transposase